MLMPGLLKINITFGPRETVMTDNKMIDTLKNLVADIDYFERLVVAESASLKAELAGKIDASTNPYEHLDIVANHFTDVLGLLSARIKLLETSLANQNVLVAQGLNITGSSPKHTLKLIDEILITADCFGAQTNFYGTEKTDTGLYYSWTGPSPVNTFELPITRSKEKFGQLRFISVVDEVLLKTLAVKIDGEATEFKLGSAEKQQIIEFKLPASSNPGVTTLNVILTNTVSPQESGKGQDKRRLGIALSGVSVTQKSII